MSERRPNWRDHLGRMPRTNVSISGHNWMCPRTCTVGELAAWLLSLAEPFSEDDPFTYAPKVNTPDGHLFTDHEQVLDLGTFDDTDFVLIPI